MLSYLAEEHARVEITGRALRDAERGIVQIGVLRLFFGSHTAVITDECVIGSEQCPPMVANASLFVHGALQNLVFGLGIDAFFEYGKLKAIPAQRKKERIVLEVIADQFEYDRIYTEREVNIIIADFHDDFCTIRRDMISEGLLDRDTKGYWRLKE